MIFQLILQKRRGKLLLLHAFEECGANRVEFVTDVRNERSITAIRAIGAAFEGVLRAHMIVQNERVRDSALFSITKDDWSAVKRQLQQRLDR